MQSARGFNKSYLYEILFWVGVNRVNPIATYLSFYIFQQSIKIVLPVATKMKTYFAQCEILQVPHLGLLEPSSEDPLPISFRFFVEYICFCIKMFFNCSLNVSALNRMIFGDLEFLFKQLTE